MNRVNTGIFGFTASEAGDHETDYLRWVVPFRPHRGIVLLVEQPTGDGNLNDWLQWLLVFHYPRISSDSHAV